MEIDKAGIRSSPSEYGRTINSYMFESDLPSLIEKMKASSSWKKGEMISKVLLDSPCRQIVLTALHEYTEIDSFQASDSVTFQIVEGKIYLRTGNESACLNKGQVLTLYEHINYNLTALEETILLLTLVKDIPVQAKTKT